MRLVVYTPILWLTYRVTKKKKENVMICSCWSFKIPPYFGSPHIRERAAFVAKNTVPFFYFLKLYCIRQGLRIFIEIEWLWDAVSPYLRCVHSLFFEKHSTPYKIRGWVFCFLLPARPTEKCRRNVRGCNAHRYFFTMKRLTTMIREYPLRCCFSFDARVFCFIFAYAPTYINMRFKRVIN